jgi:YhcH/YjgK/YiaL family protein
MDDIMVLDSLEQHARYTALHPRFSRAFEFLLRADLATLPPGRHSIDEDRLYVSIDVTEGRRRDGARLEAHRSYIDIQYTIAGEEEIGWLPLDACARPAGAFDTGKDIIFYEDRPATWLAVPQGRFAIFFPADAHAPLAGRGLLRKAIVKVAAD